MPEVKASPEDWQPLIECKEGFEMLDRGALEALRHGVERSSHWPTVEREFREEHPQCLACKDPGRAVQVHHVNPFHYLHDPEINRPDLELDPRNLVSLCEDEEGRPAEDHHLLLGHLGDFKEGNLSVREDATHKYFDLSKAAIKADPDWLSEERVGRLKPLDQMTVGEKQAFRDRLNRDLPPDPEILRRFGISI